MTNLSVTGILKSYKSFSREFWLSYKALEEVMPTETFNQIKMILMKSKRIDLKYLNMIDIAEYENVRNRIDSEWKQKNEEAKASGILMHERLHNLLTTDLLTCRKEFGIPTDKYKLMKQEEFLTCDGLYPEFRIEIPLNDEFLLIGVPDLIIKKGNDLIIIDYKTDEKISKDSHYDVAKKKKKTMLYPLTKFPDCNLSHYQLQVSMYAWMLLKLNPDFKIEKLQIYHIISGNLRKIYDIDYLKDDIQHLLDWHIKNTKLKQETLKCREIKYGKF